MVDGRGALLWFAAAPLCLLRGGRTRLPHGCYRAAHGISAALRRVDPFLEPPVTTRAALRARADERASGQRAAATMPKKKDDDLDLRFDPREELGLDPKCTFDVHIGEDGVGPKSDDGPAPDDPDVIDLGQPPDYAYYSREDPTAYEVKPLGPKKELRRTKKD